MFPTQALCGGLSMEAYVALHQADELQGIISEIKVSWCSCWKFWASESRSRHILLNGKISARLYHQTLHEKHSYFVSTAFSIWFRPFCDVSNIKNHLKVKHNTIYSSAVLCFQGELKLLHDENDMLREQVVTLANYQTNGEVTENSSTESSERLENLYKLYKVKHG